MTTTQAVEMSVTPDNHAKQITDTPGFKPFTILETLLIMSFTEKH